MYRSLLLLLVTAVLTGCSSFERNRSLPGFSVWEHDIRNFEQLDSVEKYSPDAVLFAGSSSIRLWSDIANDMAPYEVIRRGYGGAKLSDFAVYADRIISPHPCSAIVLFIANDITGSDDDKSPQQVASLFRQVLGIIRKTHPQTPVFWIEMTPTPSRWQVWEQASRANARIKEICLKGKNTYFIHTSDVFLDEKGLPGRIYFMPDMLHLNAKGYKSWSGIIKKELDKVL